jgi:hypothetical protein
MIKFLSIKNFCCFIIIIFVSCTSSKQELKDILTNNGEGKYWDLVYQTDTSGNVQEVLKEKNGLAKECIYFFGLEGVSNYYNIDTSKIINMNDVVEDIRYNGNFTITSDTIIFWGKKYKVLNIDTTSIELLDVTYGGKSMKKLKRSKLQNKIICKSIACSE